MKKTCAIWLLFFFLFTACAGRINIKNQKYFTDLCSEKKMSICSFELGGADADMNTRITIGVILGGIVGGIIAGATKTEKDPYSQELTKGFYDIYEEDLKKAGYFQLLPSKNLISVEEGKPVKLDEMAKRNNLYACVNVLSLLQAGVGFKKPLVVISVWEINKPTGEKLRFVTKAISDERPAVFVNTADPAYRPVYLELARQSVQQFLTQLGESGEEGSCIKDSLDKKMALEMKQKEAEKAALKAQQEKRFIKKTGGIVVDTQTNLMWAAKDNGSDIGWADAKSYCENYRGGGYADWRMPTSSELETLYDPRLERPAACDKYNSIHVATDSIDITCYYLWASETSERLGLIPEAAYFYFIDGGQYWVRQSYKYTYRVLPVRYNK